MSFNITTWKTKRIENLVISLRKLYDVPKDLLASGWSVSDPTLNMRHLTQEGNIVLTITSDVDLPEKFTIRGQLRELLRAKEARFLVQEIRLEGEGSGTFWHRILGPTLEDSTGLLEALLVWESGTSVDYTTFTDGKQTTRNLIDEIRNE